MTLSIGDHRSDDGKARRFGPARRRGHLPNGVLRLDEDAIHTPSGQRLGLHRVLPLERLPFGREIRPVAIFQRRERPGHEGLVSDDAARTEIYTLSLPDALSI